MKKYHTNRDQTTHAKCSLNATLKTKGLNLYFANYFQKSWKVYYKCCRLGDKNGFFRKKYTLITQKYNKIIKIVYIRKCQFVSQSDTNVLITFKAL